MRIDLPSGDGAWIELRDPETITAGDQEDLMRDIGALDESKPFRWIYDVASSLKLLMIADWNIPYLSDPQALPRANPTLLRELRIADNAALERALESARDLLLPRRPEPSDEQLADKASPTTPASG